MTHPRIEGERLADSASRATKWLIALTLVVAGAVVLAAFAVAYLYVTTESRPTTGIGARLNWLQDTVRANPRDYVSRRNLAFALQKAGRMTEARNEYKKVLSAYPDDLASLYSVGVIDLTSSDPATGVEELRQLLKVAPTHSLAAKTLGQYYLARKGYSEALAVLLPAADAHPELADLQELAGEAFEGVGSPGLAARRYRAALSLIPALTAARNGLARVGSAQ